MKTIIPLIIFIAACSAGVIEESIFEYHEGDRYFYYNDEKGNLIRVDTQDEIDQDFIDNYKDSDIEFLLFTRNNPSTPQTLILEDDESVINSNFNPEKITVFYSHGWNSEPIGGTSDITRDAYLEAEDVNIIHLDWEKMAKKNYITAKSLVTTVGKSFAAFIMWLTKHGLQYDKVHLIGHSLGAHLVGSAGRSLGGNIQRLTALDPAGPLWYSDEERLAKSDAKYVEAIHTNTAILGFKDALGDADFYPNGGAFMPGCFILDIICSHRRAPEYMASSLKYNKLIANQCESMDDMGDNKCTGLIVPMGNSDLDKFLTGIYRVNTESEYPYFAADFPSPSNLTVE